MFARLAIDSDETAVVELARLNIEETRPDMEWDEARCRETFRSYLTKAAPTIFVVEDRREIIAFLMASMRGYSAARGHFTAQEVLFVRPDKRGTRAAVILMNHLIAWSSRIGAKEIVGGNDNSFRSERTAKFLEHFGFERVGWAMRRVMADGSAFR